MATIYDVAKLAGVSPSTVSRVFNGVGVSAEKLTAVRAAVAELSFEPSRAARALRTQRTDVVALVIPDIENPYFTEVARGVEDVAQSAGYSVVLCNSDSQADKEQTYLQIAVSERMAGVIIAGASADTEVSSILEAGHPVVAIDRPVRSDVDGVMMANRDAGFEATENLIDAGFRRIACVSGPQEIRTARERARGWREALALHGMDASDSRLVHSSFRVDGGREALAVLMTAEDPPDAIVAGNNLIGVGAIQWLSEHGLTPPTVGVAVVGSLPFTTLAPSAVSVVWLPARLMGSMAAQMLLERIRGDRQPPRTAVLHGELHSADYSRR
jgi:LacI family transcriptional regulator